MKLSIYGEKPFSILKNSFAVYSPEAFTLQYSVDSIHWTSWSEESPAESTVIVNNIPEEIYFRLKGVSEDNVAIIKY